MFEYTGWGFVLPVSEAGGAQTVVDAVNGVFGESFETIEEVDDSMLFGTYESFDNIDEATFAGADVDVSGGVIVFDFGQDSPELERMAVIAEVLEELGYEGYADDPIVGEYRVSTLQ